MTTVPLDLTFRAIYRHSRAAVWAALTDPEALRAWFLQNDFEPRVGKHFSVTGPHIGTVACVVVAFEPPRRMEWSWQMPDLPAPSRVVFTLEDVEGGTRLTVRHFGRARASHETDITRGWPKRLDYLECWLDEHTCARPSDVRAPRPVDRIAIISDIHGNLPALDATLHDIGQRGIARIFCLGDLVGKGPNPDVVVDVCRDVCETVVRGNWDDALAASALEHPTIQWHRDRLGAARLQYLGSLPNVVDLAISGRYVRLFHASQRGVHFRVRRSDPDDRLLAMFENTDFTGDHAQPEVVGYGDIHEAFVRNLPMKTLFNVGSVGNPHDSPEASYAILEGVRGEDRERSPFGILLVRVPYDIDRAIQDAIAAEMPSTEPYARELRTARYRGPAEFAAERDALRNAPDNLAWLSNAKPPTGSSGR